MTDAISTEKLKTRSGHDDDGDHEGIDRISELPEHIIHHIMKFLPRYSGITTRISILSKKFFSVWCSFPVIDFNFSSNPKWDTDYVLNSIQYRLQHRRRCKNNNNCLQRLSFTARPHGGFESDSNTRIVEMIDFALQNQVKELHLNVVYDRGGPLEYHYRNQLVKLSCFPAPVFSAKSITLLSLHGFNLAQVQAQDQHLTLSCPSIEHFVLSCCSGITSITLRGAKLRIANICDCYGLEMIKVDGPTTSLDILEYRGKKNYCDIDVASSKSVKSLDIVHTDVTHQWFNSKFCGVVESLTFMWECSFPRVENNRWYFNQLKRLELLGCDCQTFVEFETPNLEYFFYAGKLNWDIPLLISSRSIEANIQVFMNFDRELYMEFYLIRFIHLLKRLIDCHTLTIQVDRGEDLIYPTIMRGALNPPFHDLKHLTIELVEVFDFSNVVALIDSLLWFAPHPNTISFIDFDTQKFMKSIKFNYHNATSKDASCCGSIGDAKCWPHHVKEVELHKFGDNEVADLQTYFFNFYNISTVISD